MKDSTEYSDLGEDFVLDEQERQTQLSNEQIQEIEQRLEAPQEVVTMPEQQAAQAATAVQTEPQVESPAPYMEGPYRDAAGNIDLEQI